MRISLLLTAALAVLLAACASPSGPPASTANGAVAAPAPKVTLASEQQRLADLFRGTPVVFAMLPDGSLRATVPRRFSFDPGANKVKAPLAAVLDRLAKGQLQSGARFKVGTPADPESRGPALARERALSVRDYLMGQGIAATRLQAGAAAQNEQVEIVVSDAPH